MTTNKINDFMTAHFVAAELAGIQEDFTHAVFKIAKKYNLDEFYLMEKAGRVIVESADDPFFREKVAPSVWEEINEEDEQEG